MANRTVKDAISVKGTNPQYLIEKIIRSRIYDSKFWKEECFALTAELLVDKAMELRYVGGVFGGNIKPTPFLCLVLKMLQIQPEKDIVVEFIKNEDFKYVRALGAYYMRLTGTAVDCYKYLEPLLNDYRKLRIQNKQGQFELIHMDELIDNLLREERYCDVILPRTQKRWVLEEANELLPRISALEEDLDGESSEDESEEEAAPPPPPILRDDHRDRERRHHREERSHRPRERDYDPRDRNREQRVDRRDPDRERSGRSSHQHSSRREREHGERHHSEREHRHREHRERDRDRRDRHGDRRDRGDREDRTDRRGGRRDIADEIAEANALRAKLGMAPLR